METEVLIVGAGASGMVLALWLARLSVRVRIIDRAGGPGRAPRAFALQARTLEFYDRLGLAKDALAQGRVASTMSLHRGRERIQTIPFGAFGQGLSPFPFVLILFQDDHEKLLARHLSAVGVQVERNTELIDLDDTGSVIQARLRGSSGGDEVCEASFVCGCDGAGSLVRRLSDIDFRGGRSEEIAFVADVRASGVLADGELHSVLSGETLYSVFPRRQSGRVRLIGLTPVSVRKRLSQFDFDDIAPEILQGADLEVSVVESFATYGVQQRIADAWRKGRIFLLGDAAHLHNPAGGQGLNAAVGDAANLAWKLGAVLRGGADPSLLDTYQSERRAAARQIAATVDRGFGILGRHEGVFGVVRAVLPEFVGQLMRATMFRRWLFRAISQIGISYRASRSCDGRAGQVAGGDRLPWVKLDDQSDNFSALQQPFPIESSFVDEGAAVLEEGSDQDGAYIFRERALGFGWQAQVYGQIHERLREACAEWGLSLRGFAWGAQMKRVGLVRDAVYLVRPDGYVAYACAGQDPVRLAEYLERFDIRFRSVPETGGALHMGLGAPQAPSPE
ncbi:MAG TPA: FAD-dependent monooxygenase [Caulobacteraceae bacterium]|jgi:2-polyprenyl-6-methoxyphenol hydroxylase-like FAD-dependent oxidoreductase